MIMQGLTLCCGPTNLGAIQYYVVGTREIYSYVVGPGAIHSYVVGQGAIQSYVLCCGPGVHVFFVYCGVWYFGGIH